MRRGLKSRLAALAVAMVLPLLASCAVNPVSGERELSLISPADEARIGRQEHAKVKARFGGVYDDPAVTGYVAEVGGRLAANSDVAQQPFTFTVLNSLVVNAFALPGGYVYITRGLMALAEDEAELAGVLAHEIGHVAARHTAQRMTRGTVVGFGAAVLGAALGIPGDLTNLGADLYLKGFSRDQEFEADLLGVRYLRRTGYDPYAQADFLTSLARYDEMRAVVEGEDAAARPPELLSTHPRTPARVVRAIEAASNSAAPPSAPRRREDYLRHIDGLLYGDDPVQGLVRGRTFSHPELRFAFSVPDGFRLVNTSKAVYARGPDKALIVLDSAKVDPGLGTREYLVREWVRNASPSDVETIEVNGMEAVTGTLRGRRGYEPVEMRLVAIRFAPDRVYRFRFVASEAVAARNDVGFRRTTYSFRRLSGREAAALKPYRIRIVRVGPGETAETLARRMAMPDHKLLRFRVLNALDEGENPAPGSRVKIVVE